MTVPTQCAVEAEACAHRGGTVLSSEGRHSGCGRTGVRGDVNDVWDNGDMYIQGDGQIVKVLDHGNGTYDTVIRDISNPSAQPTTIKDTTQR